MSCRTTILRQRSYGSLSRALSSSLGRQRMSDVHDAAQLPFRLDEVIDSAARVRGTTPRHD
jgi:hypothetical protein